MHHQVVIRGEPGIPYLVQGNQAIARGAVEARVQLATGYPGTPSTEIMEALIEASEPLGFKAYWSVNEKVAFDTGTGGAFSGARSLVVLKHVGLNVAADALMQFSLIEIAGGFVLVSVDDPGGLSSNKEQDNRHYAKFAEIPALEPANLTEAREMVKAAFEISESLHVAVMLRSVTRLAHMTEDVVFGEVEPPREPRVFDSNREFSPFPPLPLHRRLCEKMGRAYDIVGKYGFDRYEGTGTEKIGIAAAGFTYNYAREAVSMLGAEKAVAILKISTINPPPKPMFDRLLAHADRILVLEDVSPFLEEALKARAQELGRSLLITGRQEGAVPDTGETMLDDVVNALKDILGQAADSGPVGAPAPRDIVASIKKEIPRRQIGFCPGCSHRTTYYALAQALQRLGIQDPIVCGDIGCYTLGFYPPFSILKTMTAMGGSMGTALSLAQLNPNRKVIAIIGDSTFYHAGQPGLLQISHLRAPVVTIVMDNSVTASTGQQPHPGTWQNPYERVIVPIEDIARAYKIPRVSVVGAFQIARLTSEIEGALSSGGPAVIVSRQPCALLPKSNGRKVIAAIDLDKCDGCLECVENFGCPAFVADEEHAGKITVDRVLCDGCAACRPVCPAQAIHFVKSE